ncbi:MAG: protein-L-isoaspartate(D-aspartate) O-methyltransferase [Deltaproteobacteria bacterium]|nr:protein-L-isoaspartate(D-aspartate) O-methyltransferase [Deltaproteobacteria bacterium]
MALVIVGQITLTCKENRRNRVNGEEDNLTQKRNDMVDTQLAGRDIMDAKVLQAMRTVPRHAFVSDSLQNQAYADWPLPIGYQQTISQPYIVAFMTEALAVRSGHKVLEVGTGSGYQAAVLAELGAEVYTIEIIPELGKHAAETLKQLGYNVHSRVGDGCNGWPEAAPFDGILVTAAPEFVPAPLIEQLKEGGRLVIPVGRYEQTLKVLQKKNGQLSPLGSLPVRFVPMTGKIQDRK